MVTKECTGAHYDGSFMQTGSLFGFTLHRWKLWNLLVAIGMRGHVRWNPPVSFCPCKTYRAAVA